LKLSSYWFRGGTRPFDPRETFGGGLMPLKLMYITNDDTVARIAEDSGVDWIFVDLEVKGKEERQGHLDTVISRHSMSDVLRIKGLLTRAKLLVRINPIDRFSRDEIEQVIDSGGDIIMLPFFKTRHEVEMFVSLVDGRAQTCLLLETPEAVSEVDSIIRVDGIDYVHVGLNDLHLGYGMKFMFELLANGTVDMLCTKFREKGVPFGFGGVARLGGGLLPAEYVLSEHYRLGSSMVILSRSFFDLRIGVETDEEGIRSAFSKGIKEIREYENWLTQQEASFFSDNQRKVQEIVSSVIREAGRTRG
jgi:hypothetical protein